MTDEQREQLKRILGELAGAASACWETLERAGVFQSEQAIKHVDDAYARILEVFA